MRVEIEKNNKKFKIIEGEEVLLRGTRPKWYSSEIRFFHNNKTYEIKKKRFWSTSFILLESGRHELYKLVKEQGHDIVCGWKKKRYDSFFAKNLPSKLFN